MRGPRRPLAVGAAVLASVALGFPAAAGTPVGDAEAADAHAPSEAGTVPVSAVDGGDPVAAGDHTNAGDPTAVSDATNTGGVDGRLLVRWRDGLGAADRQRLVDASVPGGVSVDVDRISPHVDALTLQVADRAAEGGELHLDVVGSALASLPDVELVERDRVLAVRSSEHVVPAPAPDDPLFERQWGLHNVGSAIGPSGLVEQGVPGIDVGVLDAWSVTRGDPSVTVAVIDTLIDAQHPDLSGAVSQQVSTLPDTDTPGAHGTAVAGVIGARAGDGFGVAGVAPEVSMFSAAAFAPGEGDGPGAATLASVLAAFDAAAEAGADVINASWVTEDPSPLLRDAIVASGVPVVAAAGNESFRLTVSSPVFPVGFALRNVIGVTAIDRSGALAPFANDGPGVVDVAAPGVGVLAPGLGGGHVWADGTSFAAPHVTGALALAVSAAPYATTADLVDAVSWTSRVVPGLDASTRSGGMLDAGALVRGVQRPACRPDRLPSVTFPDVDPAGVHATGIACIALYEVTTGRDDGTFGGAAPVTREQLATFLFRILVGRGVAPDAPSAGFVDVEPDSVHAPAIDLLRHLGIVLGDDENRFRPRDTVTRGQMASLVVRTYTELTGDTRPPSRTWFLDTSTSVHAVGIDRARDLGIVRGVTRVSFDPGAPTRREQMASFLSRTLDALDRAGEDTE